MLSFLLQRFLQAKPARERRPRPALTLISERTSDWARSSASKTSHDGVAWPSVSACFGSDITAAVGPYFHVDDNIFDRESWSTTWSDCETPLIDDVDLKRFIASDSANEMPHDAMARPSDEEIIRYLDELNQCIAEALNSSLATSSI